MELHKACQLPIQDMKVGDVVWIKFVVEEPPTVNGDVLLRFLPRPGVNEYARRKVHDSFIRPDLFNWARRLFARLKAAK